MYRAVAAVAVGGLLLFFGAGGWFFSGEIRAGALVAATPAPQPYTVAVLHVEDGSVTLARAEDAPRDLTTDGVFGLEWAGGYGQMRDLIEVRRDRVVRAFELLDGEPLVDGDRVAIDGMAFPSDPRTAFDLDFEEVTYTSDLGGTPAWFVDGERSTWVLFVHGYNAPRDEALRLLEPVVERGFPALVIRYRNDPQAPHTADGLRRYGQTEWRDVEAAVRHALEQGAADVVLVGYSMGGAIVANFLYESSQVDHVRATVLDAPALDLGSVIDRGAQDRTLPLVGLPIPPALTQVAKGLAGLRFDLDWGDLDYIDRAEELSTPVLLFHGEDDATVPIASSEQLAAARPDLVTFVRVPHAGHVLSWNVDPARYEQQVMAFLGVGSR